VRPSSLRIWITPSCPLSFLAHGRHTPCPLKRWVTGLPPFSTVIFFEQPDFHGHSPPPPLPPAISFFCDFLFPFPEAIARLFQLRHRSRSFHSGFQVVAPFRSEGSFPFFFFWLECFPPNASFFFKKTPGREKRSRTTVSPVPLESVFFPPLPLYTLFFLS